MNREEAREELITFIGTFECPSLEAVEVAIEALKDRPKGEWVFDRTLEPHCSECNYVPDYSPRMDDYFFSDFCPNCGSDMRGDDK